MGIQKIKLDDLVTNSPKTGNGVSNPYVIDGEEQESIPTKRIVLNSDNTVNEINLTNNRKIADLSSLPKEEEPTNIKKEYDIQSEILDGDIFQSYLHEKKEEIDEINQKIIDHNLAVAEARGEEIEDPLNVTDEDVLRSKKNPVFTENLQEYNFDEIDDDDIEEDDDADNTFDYVKKKVEENHILDTEIDVNNMKDINFNIEQDDDFDEDEQPTSVDIDEDEQLYRIQEEVTQKIKTVSNKLDLSSFTISNKPISLNKIKESYKVNVSDWVLMHSKKHISMSSFGGMELSDLTDENDGANKYSTIMKRYAIFRKHLVGDNVPTTTKEFTKSLSYFDNDDLYMAAYIASFVGSNHIPYDCPKCKQTFLSDDIPIKSMYKFNTPDARERFNKYITESNNQLVGLYNSEAVAISDKYAFVFKEPSVYDLVIEPSLLDENSFKKYSKVIGFLSYIKGIYYIDTENKTMYPVKYSISPTSEGATYKSRIRTYAKIIKELTPDQYASLTAFYKAIGEREEGITYVKPEITCPHCGEIIPEEQISAEVLLFTRHQLKALTLTSIN